MGMYVCFKQHPIFHDGKDGQGWGDLTCLTEKGLDVTVINGKSDPIFMLDKLS